MSFLRRKTETNKQKKKKQYIGGYEIKNTFRIFLFPFP